MKAKGQAINLETLSSSIKHIFIVLSVLIPLTLLVSPALAVVVPVNTPTTTPEPTIPEEVRETMQQNKEKIKTYVKTTTCNRIKNSVQSRYQKAEQVMQQQKKYYNQVVEDVKEIIRLLKLAGYDTSKVENDLKELDSMLTTLYDQEKAFIDSMKSTYKETKCDDLTEDWVRDQVKVIRAEAKKVREQLKEIRIFVETTLIPDINEILAEIE